MVDEKLPLQLTNAKKCNIGVLYRKICSFVLSGSTPQHGGDTPGCVQPDSAEF